MTLKGTTSRPKRGDFRPNATNDPTRLLLPFHLFRALRLNNGNRMLLRHRFQMGKQLFKRVTRADLNNVNLLKREIPYRDRLPANNERVTDRSIRGNKFTHTIKPRRAASLTVYRNGQSVIRNGVVTVLFNRVEGFSRIRGTPFWNDTGHFLGVLICFDPRVYSGWKGNIWVARERLLYNVAAGGTTSREEQH